MVNSNRNIKPTFTGTPNKQYISECITLGRLAQLTGVPRWRINYLRRNGKIPFVKLSARQFLYPPYALDKYLQSEVYDENYPLEETDDRAESEKFEI